MSPCADAPGRPVTVTRANVDAHERIALADGWSAACAEPGAGLSPDGLRWIPARVPGTAAGALRDAGLAAGGDLDAEDWLFRTSFRADPAAAGEEVVLCLDGIATVAEVHLNGERVCEVGSMFEPREIDVGALLRGENELLIVCRALGPLLELQRRPRARWRTRIAPSGLRFFRTMILGRAPGFAPGPAAVGPWREVRLERRRTLTVDDLRVRARVDGGVGVLTVQALLRAIGGEVRSAALVLQGPSGEHESRLSIAPAGDGAQLARGELRVPGVERWWPHTHGTPALHDVHLRIDAPAGETRVDAGRVGFRELAFGGPADHDVERDGLAIHLNGVPVFARGALWTPADPVGMAPREDELRGVLELVRDAGMNMLRIPGTGAYESATFHDLCDELGIMLWQDLMFANFDYPIADPDFRAVVEREARDAIASLGGRPSLTVLCGNSEVEQQVAMLGLDPSLGRGELFGELLPGLVEQAAVDACWVPSAPCGGDLPFRPGAGVANYFGVGGYLGEISDARRAGVLFASECLAFSNVPDEPASGERPDLRSEAWRAGIPRDAGADWDFEDVRDHYLRSEYGQDPATLRSADPARYLELSRAVTGEVMAQVMGEWRRASSPCGGALILWLADVMPGAGWGVLDDRREPKAAYHHLRRALAPVALWMIDEGLGGVLAHVANDGPEPLHGQLRVLLLSRGEQPVGEAAIDVHVPAHGHGEWNIEAVLGRFVDASWAYRFGPPAQDAILLTLTTQAGAAAHAAHFPAGRPLEPESIESIGLSGRLRPLGAGELELTMACRRLAYGVRIHAPGHRPQDDCLTLEPGAERRVTLRPVPGRPPAPITLTALNLTGAVQVEP